MRIKAFTLSASLMWFLINLSAQTFTDSLNQQLEKLFEESTLTGMAVSIYNSDEILYSNSLGYADIGNKTPYSTKHIQNIGSVSKTYIAAALMKAVEAGKIKLDDSINDHLSFEVLNPNSPNIPIKVRHLATHTSAISDSKFYRNAYVLSEDISQWSKEQKSIKKVPISKMKDNVKMSLEDYLKAYLVKGGKFYSKSNYKKRSPGDKYQYSNVAAALLAQVIEGAVDEEFNTYSSQVVLQELGLTNSGWLHGDIDMNQHAILYGPDDKPLPKYELNTYPDGGMITSVDELTIYMMAMMNGFYGKSDYLKLESFREMMTPQWTRPEFTDTDTKGQNVGIIWDINDRQDNIGHNGSDPGTFSIITFNSKLNLGFVLLSNCGIDEEKSRLKSVSQLFAVMVDYGKKMNGNSPSKP